MIDSELAVGGIPGVDVWLVSGSRAFIQTVLRPLGTPTVGWMSDGGRRKPSDDGSGWSWTQVSHCMVGGVTKAVGMFGFVGMEAVNIPDDPIRRTIGSVIKYGERPTPCLLPFGQRHYTVDDHLSLHQMQLPVLFATGFSRTGWGHRPLIIAELAQAFDLPTFVTWESVSKSKLPLSSSCLEWYWTRFWQRLGRVFKNALVGVREWSPRPFRREYWIGHGCLS